MHPQLLTLNDTHVIGIWGQGPSGPGAGWIGALWQQMNERLPEAIAQALPGEHGAPRMLWGAMRDLEGTFRPWGSEGGQYLAGFEAPAAAAPPPGFAKWCIPGGRYLAIPCTRANYGEVFAHTLKQSLPDLGLRLSGAVQERYNPAEAQDAITLLFPVEKG